MNLIEDVSLESLRPTTFDLADGRHASLLPNGENKWVLHVGKTPLAVLASRDGSFRLSAHGRYDSFVRAGANWRGLVADYLES